MSLEKDLDPRIDKTKFIDGEWQSEPDRLEWRDEKTGLPCLIIRNNMGALCGYVGVDQSHPWYGINYGGCLEKCGEDGWHDHNTPERVINIHGGLTYSGECSNNICHIPQEGEPDTVFWFGFDTAHSGDYILPTKELLDKGFSILFGEKGHYKNIEYVKKEVTKLAKQLAKLKKD